MNIFKKIGIAISNFFKSHTVLAILLITAIVLASVWTPLIIKLSNDIKQSNSQNSATVSAPKSSGPSVFVVGGGGQASSKNEASAVPSDTKDDETVSSELESEKEESSSSKVSSPKQEVTEKLKVICWGDSITQGMNVSKDKNYPSVLKTYLGEEYEVLNAGVPGESSLAIAARQGAIEVFTARDVVIKKGKFSGYLGNKDDTGLCTADGMIVDIDYRGYAFSCQLPATVIYIDGVKYRLGVKNEEFSISTYQKAEKDITIKKGSKIEFHSSREQQNAYCEVILVGANDGLGGSTEDIKGLTERYKKMAERRKNDKYLVIVPYWLGDLFDDVFVEAFGDKAINFRNIALTTGLQLVGSRLSAQDEYYIEQGMMPPSLMIDNSTTDPLHLNEMGYKLMALLIYERGMMLGYW